MNDDKEKITMRKESTNEIATDNQNKTILENQQIENSMENYKANNEFSSEEKIESSKKDNIIEHRKDKEIKNYLEKKERLFVPKINNEIITRGEFDFKKEITTISNPFSSQTENETENIITNDEQLLSDKMQKMSFDSIEKENLVDVLQNAKFDEINDTKTDRNQEIPNISQPNSSNDNFEDENHSDNSAFIDIKNKQMKIINENNDDQNGKLDQIIERILDIEENFININNLINEHKLGLMNFVEKKYNDLFDGIESIESHIITQLTNFKKIEQIISEQTLNQNIVIRNNETREDQKRNLERIVPIIDSIEILLKSLDKKQKNQFKFLNNILRQIETQFELNLIRSLEGEVFNEKMNLVVQTMASYYPKNTIIDVVRPGIEFKGKLLRPTEVIISTGLNKKKKKYLLF